MSEHKPSLSGGAEGVTPSPPTPLPQGERGAKEPQTRHQEPPSAIAGQGGAKESQAQRTAVPPTIAGKSKAKGTLVEPRSAALTSAPALRSPGNPSPLEGEGGSGRRPETDEGSRAPTPKAGANWRHENPKRNRGFAKAMRRNPTEAERKMWLLLKDRRFDGYKFRRQVPIGRYIADFVCHSARLVVELDGSQHHGADTDRMRDDWFEAKGFATLRIWNNDLSESPESVSDAVWAKLQEKQHG